jgi:hypothetical protein
MGLRSKFSPFFNLKGGLNTEASPVNFPQDDLLQADNIWIDRDKGIVRRKGVDFIGAKASDSEIYTSVNKNTYPISHTEVWRPIFNNEQRNYVVHVLGNKSNVYEFTDPTSLKDYDAPVDTTTLFSVQQAPISFAEWNNQMFLFGGDLDTTITHYAKVVLDEDGDPVTQPQIMYMRDPENQVKDDLVKNGGKTYICILTHSSSASTEPGVGASWESVWEIFSYEDSAASPAAWVTATAYVSNVVTLDQAAENYTRRFYDVDAGDPTPGSDNTEVKVGTVAQGRVWIAGPITPETVLFSQTLREEKHEQRFYSFADPNSTVDSTIVATDGGDIKISGIGRINGILPFRTGVYVLGTKGIWMIRGQGRDEGFLPTSFTVDKIWNEGVIGYRSAIVVDDQLIFSNEVGLHIIREDEYGNFKVTRLSRKIDSTWRAIPSAVLQSIQVKYDPYSEKIYVLHNATQPGWVSQPEAIKYPLYHRASRILIFDTTVGGWYQYIIDNDSESGDVPEIAELFIGYGVSNEESDVIRGISTNPVKDGSGNQVIVNIPATSFINEFNIYLVAIKSTSDTLIDVAFGRLQELGETYTDWGTTGATDDDAVAFTSDFATAYILEEDVLHKKVFPYVLFVLERNESGGGVEQNGLKVAYDWNWGDRTKTGASPADPYLGTLVDIYTGGEFKSGSIASRNSVVQHKRRMRGYGRALSMRFQSDSTKGFRLYGWQLELQSSQRMGN